MTTGNKAEVSNKGIYKQKPPKTSKLILTCVFQFPLLHGV